MYKVVSSKDYVLTPHQWQRVAVGNYFISKGCMVDFRSVSTEVDWAIYIHYKVRVDLNDFINENGLDYVSMDLLINVLKMQVDGVLSESDPSRRWSRRRRNSSRSS